MVLTCPRILLDNLIPRVCQVFHRRSKLTLMNYSPLLPATLRPDFTRGVSGLLPAIAQDAQTHAVLMMAWMNEAAFEETLATGYATYFSRSRGKLWRKGEESGHRQQVQAIRVDCDVDTILLLVEQTGAACHEGYATCFFREYRQGRLEIIESRLVDPVSVYHRPRD
jgi:phosphoribosyl-AMP cyclohydrolase